MRYTRHSVILDLIENFDIDTQEKLVEMLTERGFKVTQATISRDIKELQLVKTQTADGVYKYTQGKTYDAPITERFAKIFRETVVSISYSGNLVVVKTLSGCANAAAEAIDSTKYNHIVGTVAGDNTFIIIMDSPDNSPILATMLNDMLRNR